MEPVGRSGARGRGGRRGGGRRRRRGGGPTATVLRRPRRHRCHLHPCRPMPPSAEAQPSSAASSLVTLSMAVTSAWWAVVAAASASAHVGVPPVPPPPPCRRASRCRRSRRRCARTAGGGRPGRCGGRADAARPGGGGGRRRCRTRSRRCRPWWPPSGPHRRRRRPASCLLLVGHEGRLEAAPTSALEADEAGARAGGAGRSRCDVRSADAPVAGRRARWSSCASACAVSSVASVAWAEASDAWAVDHRGSERGRVEGGHHLAGGDLLAHGHVDRADRAGDGEGQVGLLHRGDRAHLGRAWPSRCPVPPPRSGRPDRTGG